MDAQHRRAAGGNNHLARNGHPRDEQARRYGPCNTAAVESPGAWVVKAAQQSKQDTRWPSALRLSRRPVTRPAVDPETLAALGSLGQSTFEPARRHRQQTGGRGGKTGRLQICRRAARIIELGRFHAAVSE